MPENISQIDSHIHNFEKQGISDYLDINSTSIDGLISATEDLKDDMEKTMQDYSRTKLGYEDSDVLNAAIGVESDFDNEFQDILKDLREEASDMSLVGNVWFKMKDVFSDGRVDALAERLDPLENSALFLVEREVDKEFYTQKLKGYTETYLKPGRSGGLDNIDYTEIMTIFDQIHEKNQKYPERGALLSEEEINTFLDISGEQYNPLLVLYRHRHDGVESQIEGLLKSESRRSGVDIDTYLSALSDFSTDKGLYSASQLSHKKTLEGNHYALKISHDHVAHFLRFLYRYPDLNDAFHDVMIRRQYSDLSDTASAYRKTEDYVLDSDSENESSNDS